MGWHEPLRIRVRRLRPGALRAAHRPVPRESQHSALPGRSAPEHLAQQCSALPLQRRLTRPSYPGRHPWRGRRLGIAGCRGGRRRLFSRRGSRHCIRSGFQEQDHGALGHLVAGLEFDLCDFARNRSRHIHCCLFGFDGDQRRFLVDLLAVLHQDVDDADVLKAADIRHPNFNWTCHVRYTDTGLDFSGSMPKFCMALFTVCASILPSSDRALRAATTT